MNKARGSEEQVYTEGISWGRKLGGQGRKWQENQERSSQQLRLQRVYNFNTGNFQKEFKNKKQPDASVSLGKTKMLQGIQGMNEEVVRTGLAHTRPVCTGKATSWHEEDVLVIRNGGQAGNLVERNVSYRGCAKASRGSANMALSVASSAPQRAGQLWREVQVQRTEGSASGVSELLEQRVSVSPVA